MKTPGILKLYIRVLCDNGHDKGRHIGKLAFCHTQLKRTALDYVSGSGFCRNLDRRCMDRLARMTGWGCLKRNRGGCIPSGDRLRAERK